MSQQQLLLTILGIIIVMIAVSVGITMFTEVQESSKPKTVQTQEAPAPDPTPAAKVDGVSVSTGPARMQGIIRHYVASDYNLQYRGTVVGYSPNSDYLNGLEDGLAKREKIFIQITQSDGITKTQEVPYETWLILGEGSIIE